MTRLLVILVGALLIAVQVASAQADPWQKAAAELSMPVLAPSSTAGLVLKRVVPRHIDCGAIKEELDAFYTGGPGRKLRIGEGKPYYCGDLGDAKVVARTRIHGKKAVLYDYCEGLGCQSATDTYALYWREQGIQLTLISRGTPQAELVAIGRSMTRVEG